MKTRNGLWAGLTALLALWFATNIEAADRLTTLQVASGQDHGLALRSDGTVWTWGANFYGALGITGLTNSSSPVRVPGLSNIVQVAAGANSSYAVTESGTVFAWGNNPYGGLGDGSMGTVRSNPVQVLILTNALMIAAGEAHALALTKAGRVYAWGDGYFYQNGSTIDLSQPTLVSSLSNVTAVSAGYYNSLALTTNREVWAWGDGEWGGLGGGVQDLTEIPTKISALSNIVQIASGENSGHALDSSNRVWVWGYNDYGQLGNASFTTQAVSQVAGLSNTVEIAAGNDSALAKDRNGTIWIWGDNNELMTAPAALATTEPLTGFARGLSYTVAINRQGEVWSWGGLDLGQLGDASVPRIEYQNEPAFAFSPFPHATTTRINRRGGSSLNLASSVIPLEFQKGVALPLTGFESYSYQGTQPWFLRVARTPMQHVNTQTAGTTNLTWFTVENPVLSYGNEAGLTPIFTQRPYSFGFHAGGYDESDGNGTNAIRISVYSRSSFASGATNVSPTSTYYISIPRRTVAAESNLWISFVSDGLTKLVETNGLKTRLELVGGQTDSTLPWDLSYLTPRPTNFFLFGLRLTHVGTDTNLFYRVDVKAKLQVATNKFAFFATNSSGQWDYVPMYTLDFVNEPAQRALLVDRPMFQGLPLPPPYLDKNVGPTMAVTTTYSLSDVTYTNLDNSPELRRHPVLDQFVEKMGRDPLALANYVLNEIELVDPLAAADLNQNIKASANAGGVNRSALGTFLEGQGSPVEQCALLVYLLRQAGYPASYAFPTNHNIRLRDTRLSHLWQIQVRGVINPYGDPVLTNALVSVGYPWVTANIGTNTVHVFPWLKDTEIVEGHDFYDFMPAGYDTARAWVTNYIQAKTNLLWLDPENNNLLSLFPKFVTQQLASYPTVQGLDLDSLGMRVFNRRNHYPTWSHLPKPDFVTNLSQVTLVGSLSDSPTNYPFLTNIFDTVRVNIYRDNTNSTNLVLTTGDWHACEFNNRKLLLYTNGTDLLTLWLAPYHSGVTATNNFSGPSGAAKQITNFTLVSTNELLKVQIAHTRRVARVTTPVTPITMFEFPGYTNEASCNKADIVGICVNFGRVTPAMQRLHAEDYWAVQRQRATNTSYIPPITDNQGTAAFLLGMNYFEQCSRDEALLFRLHKARGLMTLRTGLGLVGYTGSTNTFQPIVDMPSGIEVVLGNGSLRFDSGDAFSAIIDPLLELIATSHSALEHQVINSTFPSTNAISTVRLLQLASLRATNGNAGIVTLTKRDFQAKGELSYTGYGANLLKNVDVNLWASISNAFNLPEGEVIRAYVTPGLITNATASYIGMGALILGKSVQSALISGNHAPLSGGMGDTLPSLVPSGSSPNMPWAAVPGSDVPVGFVQVTIDGQPTLLPEYSPTAAANITSQTQLTPYQQQQANNAAASLNIASQPATSNFRDSINAGDTGGSRSWFRNFFEPVFDPVSSLSGEFYVDTTDLSLPGPLPLEIRRNYLSRSLITGSLGYGWKLGFTPHLVLYTNASQTFIQAADPDGAVIVYRPTGSDTWGVSAEDNPTLSNNSQAGKGSVFNAFNGRIDRYLTNGTEYVVTTPNGHHRRYQVMTGFGVTSGTNTLDRIRPYLTRWEDHAGNFHSFSYGTSASANDFGQLNRIESANGNFISFDYDFYGRITEAFTGDGRRVSYTYDNYGDLTAVTLPDASQWQYEYQHYTFTTNSQTYTDSNHLMVREVKPNGRLLVNYYDDLRRVTHQAATVSTNFNLVTNAWFYYTNNCDSLTNAYLTGATRVEDVLHNPTVYFYTSNFITKIVDPVGRVTEQNWFESGETNEVGYYPRSLQFTVDPRGLTNHLYYSTSGNVLTNILAGDLAGSGGMTDTATNTFTYTTNHLPATVTDAMGNVVEFSYEVSGDPFLPSKQVRKAGATAVATNLMSYTNMAQIVNGRTNQAFGLMWQTVRAGLATNETYFDGRGFPTMTIAYPTTAETVSTDLPVTNYLSFNARGQLYQTTDGAGGTNIFDFDAMGRMKSKEVYSEFGEALAREFFYYNRNGELEWYDGPRSNPDDLVWNAYDGAGRKVTEQRFRSQARWDGDGVEAVPGDALFAASFWEFDGFGNLLRFTNPRGVTTTNGWDAIGRLLKRVVLETNGVTLATELFSYEPGGAIYQHTNALGGVTTTLYTSTGQPRFRQLPTGATNGWTYYLDGRPKREYRTSGAYWETSYDDAARRATKVYYTAGGTPLATNITELNVRGQVAISIDAAGFGSTNKFDGLDRVKSWKGPLIIMTSTNDPSSPADNPQPIQQTLTTYYGLAGRAVTNVNALGEKSIAYRDALGRTTRSEVRTSGSVLVRESSTGYDTNHHSVTVTNGSGAGAVVSTTYTDVQGRPVLAIAYPTSGVKEFTRSSYDSAGNLVATGRFARTNSAQTQFTAATFTYDGLNRLVEKLDRDGAFTTFAYDPAGNLTNQVVPGGLIWNAAYSSAGQMLTNWNQSGGGTVVRANGYTYYSGGNAWAGLALAHTDARGVVCTNYYDDWLRVTTNACTGPLDEQKVTTVWLYDERGLLTNAVQRFASTNTAPDLSVVRVYNAYGQLTGESTIFGTNNFASGNAYDSAGRRGALRFGMFDFAYRWRADGVLTNVHTVSGDANFGYDSVGLLTNRTSAGRGTVITARDGVGRPLALETKVNGVTQMTEALAYTGDGLIAGHTAARGDFTDGRSYAYASLSRRLAAERLNMDGSTAWTNVFTFDSGAAAGAGVLTRVAKTGTGGAEWNAHMDAHLRVDQETNNVVRRLAYGRVNMAMGAPALNIALNGKPVPFLTLANGDTNWPTRWQAQIELLPGTHTLTATAIHPSKYYTNVTTTTFTNQALDQTVLTYYSEGQLTQRVWKSSGGTTNRVQVFKWDGRGRLFNFSERDTSNDGHDWTAIYDAFGRRVQARTVPITNNVAVTSQLKVVTQLYDPLVEFLELGVRVDERWHWKVYGPDLNGVYGGMNGVGGWEAVVSGPDTYHPLLADARGNIVGAYDPDAGSLHWNAARITGYGSVAEHRPLSLGEGSPLWEAGSWRGRFPEMSGLYNLGARYYDPVAGRFLSADPLGHDSDPSLYSFANGDPINYFDADGRLARQGLNTAGEYAQIGLAGLQGAIEYVNGVAQAANNPGRAAVNAALQTGLEYLNNLQYFGGSHFNAFNQTVNPAAQAGVAFGEAFGGYGMSYHNSGQALDGWDRTSSFVEGVGATAETVGWAAGAVQFGMTAASGSQGLRGLMSADDAARYDAYWAQELNGPTRQRLQIAPGTQSITDVKLSTQTGQPYVRQTVYDEYGRVTGVNDFTTHGRPQAHTDPHHHRMDSQNWNQGIQHGPATPGLHPDTP